MKIKVVIIILAVACVGLVIGLIATEKKADDVHTADLMSIEDFSNRVVKADALIAELGQVNLTLSNDLSTARQELTFSQEQLAALSNSLATASVTLADTKSSLAGAQEMVTNLNARIADLEAQNRDLDARASALSNQLAQLTIQIENTRNHLAISETNNTYLQGELQKQLAQKAELEHKFNNLAELRAQVKRMKDEMFVARRIQLMKNDNGFKKGASLLMAHQVQPSNPAPVGSTTTPRKNSYDLNVEVGSDGTVKVIPPIGGTNNAAQ